MTFFRNRFAFQSFSLRSHFAHWGRTALVFIVATSLANAWEIYNPFVGVTYSKLRDDDVHPILNWSISPLSVDVMEIDLDAQGIGFVTTPSNGSAAGYTTRQTTMNFMKSTNSQIAVNSAFYVTSGDYNCHGRHYSAGEAVNPNAEPGYNSVNITPDNLVEWVAGESASGVYPFWNTFSGGQVLVLNGQVLDDGVTARHPRTAVGYNASENKLILMTVDGRQDASLGVKTYELGLLMANFGATWAINLDGGGSTQMTMNTGTPVYVNSPSETYRRVATNVGVYAIPDDTFHVFANFEHNNKSTFEYRPGYSGSTYGIVDANSTATLVNSSTIAGEGSGVMRLIIDDDSAASGEWFTRFVSGSSATQSQNIIREATGYVGLMAKTYTQGAFVSLAIDAPNTGDRGVRKSLIADGQWHWYQWNLDDVSQWDAWTSAGDGVIDSANFTIDSVQFWGTTDAMIYIDQITHNADGALAPFVPGDANGDDRVDGSDVAILSGNWQHGVGGTANATWSMGDFNGDGRVDGSDVTILAGNWQYGVSLSAATAVPEPSVITLLLGVLAGWSVMFLRRRG